MYHVTTKFLRPYQTEEIILEITSYAITIALLCLFLLYHATRILQSIFRVAITESQNTNTSTCQVRVCIRGSESYKMAELKALKRIEVLTNGSSRREHLQVAVELKDSPQTYVAFENTVVPVLNRLNRCSERLLGVEVILPPNFLPISSEEYAIQHLYEDDKRDTIHLSTAIRIGRDRCAKPLLQRFSWNGSLMWLPPQWAGLSYLSKCNHLSTLTLRSCNLSVDDLFQLLCHCRSLTTLEVQMLSSTASTWKYPLTSSAAQELHPLTTLILFSSVDLTFFFSLINLSVLKYLTLDFAPAAASEINISKLKLGWKNLERLHLRGHFTQEDNAQVEIKLLDKNRFQHERTSNFDM